MMRELSVQIREACSVSWEEAINSRRAGPYLRKWSEFERVVMAALVPTIVGIACWPFALCLREERERLHAVTPATRTETSLLYQNHPLGAPRSIPRGRSGPISCVTASPRARKADPYKI